MDGSVLIKFGVGFDMPDDFQEQLNSVLETIRTDIEHIDFKSTLSSH
jgi:hypothetical protein